MHDFPLDVSEAGETPSGFDQEWAEQYAERYADRDKDGAVIDFLLKHGGTEGEYLDLCCGVGRIAVPLAARGVHVTGVDSAPAMLEAMVRQGDAESVEAILGDCTTVRIGRSVSLVYITFNSIFQLDGTAAQELMLANAARHLAPGGKLTVEAFVPRPPASSEIQGPVATHVSGSRLETTTRRWDVEEQTLWVQRMIVDTPGDVRLRSLRFRYLFPAQLDELAARAGFELEGEFADWAEKPLLADSDNRVAVYRLTTPLPG